MVRVLIIGGGISGLALAHRIGQYLAGAKVTILEKENRPGGTIATVSEGGFLFEKGPNGFLDNNPATLNLSRELGLEAELIHATTYAAKNRFLFLNGKLQLLPGSLLGFLGTGILSWKAKLSLLMERFCPPLLEDRDETVAEFAKRRVGQEVADRLVDPFVSGIFAGDPDRLSMKASFPRITAMEKEHGSVFKGFAVQRHDHSRNGKTGPKLWSYRAGMEQLIASLVERTGKENVRKFHASSLKFDSATQCWKVSSSNGEEVEGDICVLACPAHAQAELLKPLDLELGTLVGTIPYTRLAVVVMAFRSGDVPISLKGFGFLVPSIERRRILGAQWCSSIYPGRAPAGMVLLRAMIGGVQQAELLNLDDQTLANLVYQELRETMSVQSPAVFTKVIRWEKAIPQYLIGHCSLVEKIEEKAASHAGLFLTGNAYKGIALNSCIENAEPLAVRISRWWSRERLPQ